MQPDNASPKSSSPPWNQTTKVFVGVFLIFAFGLALYLFRIALVPILIGSITAYMLYPFVNSLSEQTRLPYGVATGMVYLILLAVTVPLIASAVPFAVEQLSLLGEQAGELLTQARNINPNAGIIILGIEISTAEIFEQAARPLIRAGQTAATTTVQFVLDAAQVVLLTVFTLIIGYYLTRDGEKIVDYIVSLIPDAYQRDANHLVDEIDQIWTSYYRGQILVAIIVGLLVTLLMRLIGMPQPGLIGLVAGIMEFLPGVGSIVWLFIALIVALAAGSSTVFPENNVMFAFVVIGVHFLVTLANGTLIAPRLIKREINLHPMVIIIGILAGWVLIGVLGVILASPIAATLVVVGRYIYSKVFNIDAGQRWWTPVITFREETDGETASTTSTTQEKSNV